MKKFLIPLIVVLAVTGYQSLFIVQEINQAIVLQFELLKYLQLMALIPRLDPQKTLVLTLTKDWYL